MTTATPAPTSRIVEYRALVPVSYRVDMGGPIGSLLGALPEEEWQTFMHDTLLVTVDALLRAGHTRPDGTVQGDIVVSLGPTGAVIPGDVWEIDRATGEPILSPEQEVERAGMAVLLDMLKGLDD